MTGSPKPEKCFGAAEMEGLFSSSSQQINMKGEGAKSTNI